MLNFLHGGYPSSGTQGTLGGTLNMGPSWFLGLPRYTAGDACKDYIYIYISYMRIRGPS